MARPFSKQLVVDASIARAAGGPLNPSQETPSLPENPGPGQRTSSRCRKVLRAILTICHRLVWTKDVRNEWDTHASRFSKRWRLQMVRKGKVVEFDDIRRDGLAAKIDAVANDEANRFEMQKDRLLLEAALAADNTVLSLNEKDRRRFAAVCDNVQEIQNIVWSNPNRPADACLDWLNQGARPDAPLRLKNYATS